MAMPLAAHRFTVDEYHRMGQAGVFHEDDRVELIDGQVVEMTPIGPAHSGCVNRLNALFAPLAGRQSTVSVQNPVVMGEHRSERASCRERGEIRVVSRPLEKETR